MTQRLGLALATLAAGAGLLATAAVGFSAQAKSAGIVRVGGTGNLDSIDPAIADATRSWMFENATAATLFRYADGSVVPEVAKRFTVSKNGRVYRFFLRRGYRFSDGRAVRAGSFAYAIKRALNRQLGSPGVGFVSGIVGAAAYMRGTANSVRGVTASGLKLRIRLVRADPNLPAVLTLPFFQATSSKLSLTEETLYVNRVGDLPTAGPYTWSFNNPNHRANIVRNPYYRGPRGRHVAGVQFDMRLDNTCFEETKTSQLDIGCVPPDQVVAVAQQYGVSRTRPVGTGRFWVTSTGCELPLLFNHRKALFSGNTRLRQAVNWAVDRTAVAEASNPYAVTPWTHILPPGFPGAITARRLQPYSLRPDLAKARQLAAGHLGDGNIRVAYQSAGTIGPAMAVMVRQALIGLGFDPSRTYMQGFAGFNIYEAAGARGTPFDLVVGTYICSDSPDPVSLIGRALNVLGDFSAENAAYNRKLAALSSRPPGKARLRALGRFDLEVTKKLAPVAVIAASNDLTFFSNRVDPASLRYSPVSGWSFTALRLK